jgi:hypothetical protein
MWKAKPATLSVSAMERIAMLFTIERNAAKAVALSDAEGNGSFAGATDPDQSPETPMVPWPAPVNLQFVADEPHSLLWKRRFRGTVVDA